MSSIMLLHVKITRPEVRCDWCGRESDKDLISITLVTPHGAFRDEICASCQEAYFKPALDE